MPDRVPTHRPILSLPKHAVRQTDRQSTRAYHTGSKAWALLRRKVLVRDGFCCVLCGHFDESNHVDHIDGNSWKNDMSNLRTLCQPCHAKHGKQGDHTPSEHAYVIA